MIAASCGIVVIRTVSPQNTKDIGGIGNIDSLSCFRHDGLDPVDVILLHRQDPP